MQSQVSLSSWGCCCTDLQATNRWIWLHRADRWCSGTGKTSMIKALAAHTGRNIVNVPLGRIKTNQELMDCMFDLKFNVPGQDMVLSTHLLFSRLYCLRTCYSVARHSLSNQFLTSLYSTHSRSAHSPTHVSELLFVSTLNLHFAANSNGFQEDHLCAGGCGCCHLCCAQTLWRSLSSIHCQQLTLGNRRFLRNFHERRLRQRR